MDIGAVTVRVIIARVATVREKYVENDFFQVREKSGSFMDGQGNLEKNLKVREKSGNLKINGYGRQTSELFKREKMYFFMRQSRLISLLTGGLLLKERICSLGEQILSFKNNPPNLK